MRYKTKAIAVFVAVFFIFAGLSFAKIELSAEKEIVFKVDRDSNLSIENISGEIIINSWNRNEIKVYYKKIGIGYSKSEAQDNLERINVRVNKSGNYVKIDVDYKRGGFLSFGKKDIKGHVDFDIKVPADCRLDISNVSGDTKITGIKSEIDTSNVSGDSTIRDCEGRLRSSTVSGNLIIEGHNGNINTSTVSGDAILRNLKGSLSIEGVSGDLVIDKVSISRLKCETVSGDIRFDGVVKSGGEIELKTVSGDIKIELPSDPGAEYSFNSFSGDLTIYHPDGKVTERSKDTSGTVGKGKVYVEMKTLSGDVKLKFK